LRPIGWMLVSTFWSALVIASVVSQSPAWLRAPAVLGFVVLCPGFALVRLLEIPRLAMQFALSVAVSISLGISVASLLLYARVWSPGATLAVLIGLTLIAGCGETTAALHRSRR